MPRIRKSAPSDNEFYEGQHRFEHWYVDNQVYFLTARVRDHHPALRTENAKAIFWDRFDHYTKLYRFVPWVTSVMDNHYHSLGYLRVGDNLGPLMQRLHGSVAKLVNDLLPERVAPFWGDVKHNDYMDGCIRDEKQGRCAYRYTLTQSVRHGIVTDHRLYAHTRVNVELDRAIKRAYELGAFLEGVPYKRYQRAREDRRQGR